MSPSDDKVEESHLSSAFDITCRAWQVRGRFSIWAVILTYVVATIWRPLHVLWLSVAGQLLFSVPWTILTSVTGGYNRPETQPPFRVVLRSEEIPNPSTRPRRLPPRDAS